MAVAMWLELQGFNSFIAFYKIIKKGRGGIIPTVLWE